MVGMDTTSAGLFTVACSDLNGASEADDVELDAVKLSTAGAASLAASRPAKCVSFRRRRVTGG